MKLQPAVKKETGFIAVSVFAGTAAMILIFYLLHRLVPDTVPFDARVVAGGAVGGVIAVLNFFGMAVSVQKVTNTEDEERARQTMSVSYRYRTLMQLAWVVIAFLVPVFNGAAGFIPLLIPSLAIKVRGIFFPGKGA